MKSTSKIISIVLCFAMLISLAVTSVVSADSVPALDKEKPYIEATSEPVKAGETAKVTFTVGNNPGIWAIQLELDYDDSLSLIEGETNDYGTFPKFDVGSDFKSAVVSPIDNEYFMYLYTNSSGNIISTKKNGELFSVYFKVADDAKPGDYSINIASQRVTDVSVTPKDVEFTYSDIAVQVYSDEEPPIISSTSETSSSETSSSESSSSETSSSETSSSETSSSESSSSESSSSESSSSESSSSESSSSESSSSESSSSESSSSESSSSESSSSESSSSGSSSSESSSLTTKAPTTVRPTSTVSTTASVTTTVSTVKNEMVAPNLTAVLSGKKQVSLSWSAVKGAKSYEIFRAEESSKSYKLIKKLTAVSFTDTTVEAGKKYTYKVRALNESESIYKDSAEKTVSVMKFTAKTKNTLKKGKNQITVKLKKKVKYADGYQIKYSTDKKLKKAVKNKTVNANKSSLKIKKLKSGKKYYVKVRAYKIINGKKIYGKWSKISNVKTK
ncbi:MAG: hypothetical protein ACI39F_02705 [Acutalibacteraceae bacterium]